MAAARVTGFLRRVAADRLGGPVLVLLGTVAGFVVLAFGGYQLVNTSNGISPYWPPNGFVVALLVLLPSRLRPWVLAGVMPAELAADTAQGVPALTALSWGVADLVESVCVALIFVRIARGRPSGGTHRDFVALGAAALGGAALGGIIGGAVSFWTYGGSLFHAWRSWWLGDATGIFIVVPLLLSFARPSAPMSARRRIGGLAEVGLVVAVSLVVFGATKQPVEILVLLPIVLIAIRHELRLVAIASVGFSITGTILTANGLGPLSRVQSIEVRALALQSFIVTVAFVGFVVSASIAERRKVEAAFEHLATHDPLTSLPNRRLFMWQLDQASARHERSAERAAVMFLDLDRFKETNDTLGHAAGDAVLVAVAGRLAASLRKGDVAARIGGDEFAVLLKPVDGMDGAEQAARRIQRVLQHPVAFDGTSIPVGVSVGIALVDSDVVDVLARADAQLYQDKAREQRSLRTASPA